MTTSRRSFLASVPAAATLLTSRPRQLLGEITRPTAMPAVPPEGPLDPAFWRELRSQFLVPDGEEFFNTGTLGSPPRVVLEATVEHLTHTVRAIADWDYKSPDQEYITGYNQESVIRGKLAALLGAEVEEVALTQNATMAMNFVSNGLELDPGDEVVLLAGSHTGARGGWELRERRQGIRLRPVTAPAPAESPEQLFDLYREATTSRTRVWVIQHLTSGQGAIRFPARAMCQWARERGILTVVDGAQTLGHLQVDMHEMACDAFLSSPHKWLLAPAGTGVLFVRKEHHRALWATLASAQWDNFEDGLYRLMQYGTGNRSILAGLERAIDFYLELGPARVEDRILGLSRRLRDGLGEADGVFIRSSSHPELLTATTIWGIRGVPGARLQDELWNRGRVRVRQNADGVRQCCHIYNSEEGVDRTIEIARILATEAG